MSAGVCHTLGVVVRPLLSADLPRLAMLAQVVHRTDGYPPHLPDDQVLSFVASDDALVAWVAIDDVRVVGHVALHPASSADGLELAATELGLRRSDFGVVARLLVDPTMRGSGIGRQLLDLATTECRRRGLVPILDVVDRFEPAIGLYEGAGWRRLGTVDVELPDGTNLREHVYVAPEPSDAGNRLTPPG